MQYNMCIMCIEPCKTSMCITSLSINSINSQSCTALWGGAVLQISVETPTTLCQAICRSCQSYTLQIYWRLEERRDGAVSRVVSVFFCAVYIVLLGQCYVAMPSGYRGVSRD